VTEIESIQYCEESVEIFKRKMGIEFNKSQYFEEDNCKGARDKRFIGNKSQTRRIDWKSTRNNEGRAPNTNNNKNESATNDIMKLKELETRTHFKSTRRNQKNIQTENITTSNILKPKGIITHIYC